MKYIKELTEFGVQQLNNPVTPWVNQPNDPNLSFDPYDRYTDQTRMANLKLNTILASLIQTGNVYNNRTDRIIDRQDLANLVIQRIYSNDSSDIDIYIRFDIADKEYFGVIKNFIMNPSMSSECFRDGDLLITKEWIIRTRGLIIKAIKKWFNIASGFYKANKEIYVTDNLTGTLYSIKLNQKIEVLRCVDDKIIANIGKNIICTIDGNNYYYFNYYFDKTEK